MIYKIIPTLLFLVFFGTNKMLAQQSEIFPNSDKHLSCSDIMEGVDVITSEDVFDFIQYKGLRVRLIKSGAGNITFSKELSDTLRNGSFVFVPRNIIEKIDGRNLEAFRKKNIELLNKIGKERLQFGNFVAIYKFTIQGNMFSMYYHIEKQRLCAYTHQWRTVRSAGISDKGYISSEIDYAVKKGQKILLIGTFESEIIKLLSNKHAQYEILK